MKSMGLIATENLTQKKRTRAVYGGYGVENYGKSASERRKMSERKIGKLASTVDPIWCEWEYLLTIDKPPSMGDIAITDYRCPWFCSGFQLELILQ